MISLSEFVFYLKTSGIKLENVCNWRRKRFIIQLFCFKMCPKFFSKIYTKFTKKCPNCICPKINCPNFFCPKVFGVIVRCHYQLRGTYYLLTVDAFSGFWGVDKLRNAKVKSQEQ